MTDFERPSTRSSDIVPLPDPAIETLFFPPDAVLLDTRSGEPRLLNASAALVWLLIEPGASLDQLVTEVAAVTGQHPTELRPDVETALEQLSAAGLFLHDPELHDPDVAQPTLLLGPPEP